ncbi:hypothetical protein CKO40_21075 [Halochromatium glycolicum]|uniref:Uncharacterized protein n=1 Tax=Halochromatium glycolicum TaxID=85075 RepID=A0AAJ0U912_9GAMM|nr:hypothetical protein [Halochromatium glycolicum]
MHRLLRHWHTLRHLRPVQFYGRLWFRLYRPRLARPDRSSAGCCSLTLRGLGPGFPAGTTVTAGPALTADLP